MNYINENYVKNYYSSLKSKNSSSNDLTILLYHGVTKSENIGIQNYNKKHILEHEFRLQMQYLKVNCTVLSMDEVLEIHKNGLDYPNNAVVVTFDDGFENNFSIAAPILIDCSIPATFYLSSGMINTDLMFWVDELECCFNETDNTHISIEWGSEAFQFSLENSDMKIRALEYVKSLCKNVPVIDKNNLLDMVKEATNIVPKNKNSANYKILSWNQVREMNNSPLFIFGGHTLYHDILSKQTNDSMELDIVTSIKLLEYNLGSTIRHYSYPEGQENHYGADTVASLKANGIYCSPSAICGTNNKTVDMFNLKRIMVGFYGLEFPYFDKKLIGDDKIFSVVNHK